MVLIEGSSIADLRAELRLLGNDRTEFGPSIGKEVLKQYLLDFDPGLGLVDERHVYGLHPLSLLRKLNHYLHLRNGQVRSLGEDSSHSPLRELFITLKSLQRVTLAVVLLS